MSIEPELIAGSGGVLDVVVDGDTIFSKHQAGRWPELEELVKLIEDR